MPSSTRNDAEQWRHRAAEMRAVAKETLDSSKQTMLEIALSYERLIQHAEGRENFRKSNPKWKSQHRSRKIHIPGTE
jgi:hypothetical protein